ncbi:hypothetical protein AK812_SmicGene6301 [Symbiodinium microadriaticum]|uniref:Uncharacterized protein n=1 Tax=Symbiodinium microadriaticum TaxID=2951 RepID=A0A1Q9ERG9_SYMMI|nr:hypothetical protein AK812_SmicGene6301 [Symbiodinium microadriaticum]
MPTHEVTLEDPFLQTRSCRFVELRLRAYRIYKCCSKPLELRPRTASCLDAGDFSAIGADGESVMLESLGAAWIGAVDSKGEALEVKEDSEGVTLDIHTTVQAKNAAKLEVLPEMWSFDEETGKWQLAASDMAIDGCVFPTYSPQTFLTAMASPTSRDAAVDYKGLGHKQAQPEARTSRKWYLVGAGLALLGVAGVAAKVAHSGGALFSSSATRGGTIQEAQTWEELPGIDKVIRKAQSLKQDKPLRNLQDLFYDSQPEELPWIRTECVIDTVQAAAYLGQAVVFLYKAIDYDGLECPNNSPVGCAASVAGFITSISWIASYLSFAANACGNAVNNGALCAGDFTALMANFGEIATVGAAARADCDFGKNALQILTRTETISPPWKEFVPAGASPAVDKALKIKGHKDQQRNRDYDIVQCAVDVTNSASYIVRVILQIRAAGSACADPKSCAVGIMNIISSFAWISQFTALAVSDCQVGADQKALCTADISATWIPRTAQDMVAALTNGPAAGIASTSAYRKPFDPEKAFREKLAQVTTVIGEFELMDELRGMSMYCCINCSELGVSV